jgi:magnesium transporter
MAHAAPRAETAAQLAVARVPVVQGTETVRDALHRFRGQDFDEVDTAFVVDADERLVGAVPLSALLAAPDEALIADWARPATLVRAGTDQEHVAMQAVRHGAACVAVVDDGQRLLGAVPARRLLLVLHREHVEDLHKLAGILHETAQAEHALADPPLRRARHRLPWLLVGLAGSAVATAVASRFEAALTARVAIAFFMPGIVYLADAIGTQTEAIAVRFLSLGGGRLRLGPLLRGEALTGLAVGLSLGGLATAGVFVAYWDILLALAVGLSILAAGTMAATIGLFLPWLLSRRGLDPAFGSGPVATVIQDVLSLIVYFTIASLLLLP